jgi:hypothetical protein
MILSPLVRTSPDGETILSKSGTAWTEDSSTGRLIKSLGEYREQKLRSQLDHEAHFLQMRAIDRLEDLHYECFCEISLAKPSFFTATDTSNLLRTVVELPAHIEHVEWIEHQGARYEFGRDYTLKGEFLEFRPRFGFIKLGSLNAFGVSMGRDYTKSFWSAVFAYPDYSPRVMDVHRAVHAASQSAFGIKALMRLVGAALSIDVVSQECTVVDIKSKYGSPIVVTDKQTLHGIAADTPTVLIGDKLHPGDTVFDSLRLVDATSPLPSWFTELKIPSRFFNYKGGPVSITSTEQPAAGYDVDPATGMVHLKIPVEGEVSDISAFHEAMAAREKETEYTIAEFLKGQKNVSPAQASQLASVNLDWLQVLWSIWLRFGVSISVVRDAPTDIQLARLSQVRRIMPPWFAHIFHFLDPASDANDFC